jgi:hypothetical protein
MDLGFEGFSPLSVGGDLRANAGIGRKVPFDFYNLTNIYQVGLASSCSLIGQMELIAAEDAILRSLFPLR